VACYRAVTAAALREKARTPGAKERADEEAERAMSWLRRAVVAGFRDKDGLVKRKDFDALRDRADFREWIAKLEAKPK
jgi:hypothetical protein